MKDKYGLYSVIILGGRWKCFKAATCLGHGGVYPVRHVTGTIGLSYTQSDKQLTQN